MYAVIETGGKQYRVELGSEIEIATLSAEPGQTVDFERVLLVADGDESTIGRPLVENARVSASVVRHDRGDKIVVFKYRPKARRRVKHGHRQDLTLVRISDIVLGARSAARDAEADRAEEDRARAESAKAAEKQAAADRALADKLAREKQEAEAKAKKETAAREATSRKSVAEGAKVKAAAAEKADRPDKTEPPKGSTAKPDARTTTKPAAPKTSPGKPAGKASGAKAGSTSSGSSTRKVQAPEPSDTKSARSRSVKPRSAGSKTRKDS